MSTDQLYNPAQLTIMIVDDQDPIRKSLKRLILGMHFGEVVECHDGDEALKVLAAKPIDLIVLDLFMRHISGFEVLEHVRTRAVGCDIPVIVVTGEASKEEIVKVADMGAEDYLLKPFQAADLEKKIIRTLNAYFSPSPMLKVCRKAERHVIAKEHEKALEMFEQALKLDPDSARATYGKAITLEKLSLGDVAVKLLEESIQKNHSYHKNYAALADILLKQNKVKDAIEAMRKELEINPKQPNRQVHLAKLLLKEGDAMGAVDHYRVALQEDPKRLAALMGMGHAYAMADNLDKALYYFKRVRRYHPTATKALEAAVRCSMQANEPKKAELFLKDERSAHPAQMDTYLLLAMFLLKQDRDDDAMTVANDLLDRDEENVQAWRIKATVWLKKSDYTNALAALLTVAKVAPSADILVSTGECYLHLVKIPEAMEALNKAIAMNPDGHQAFFLLAEAHRKSQQWGKASHLYRRAAQLGAPHERCAVEIKDCTTQMVLRRTRPRIAS